MNQTYLDTARLLTQVAPLVFVDDTFALKGGTAINLFVRDMPRLSVDLDLVFPDHTPPRDEALAGKERRFLLSLVAGAPEWTLLGIDHLEHLPGVRWKLQNLAQLQKTNPKKFAEQADLLGKLGE